MHRLARCCRLSLHEKGMTQFRANWPENLLDTVTGETGGIPIGLLARATYEEHVVTLSRGDRLYLCTDGIMEAENTAEEEFGVERLLDTLDGSRDSPLGDSLCSVMMRVEQWSAPTGAADGASMLAIERCG